MKSPKAPKKTAEEVAMERRQTMLLDKTIEEEEERFKTLARGKYGRSSLLSGAGSTRAQAAGGGTGGRAAGVGAASGSASATVGSGAGMYGGSSPRGSGIMSKR